MGTAIEIVQSEFGSPLLNTLYRWFSEEWNEVDPFPEQKNGVALPAPLVALHEGVLVGGLAFTGYRKPESDEAGLWICALYVTPDERRRGIASKLIQAAERLAQQRGFAELYARTESPVLYEKQSWVALREDAVGVILRKTLRQ